MPKNNKQESDSVDSDCVIIHESCDNKEKAVTVKGSQKELRKQHLEEKQKQKEVEKMKKDAEKKQKEEERKRKELERENEKKKKELEKEEERKKRELDKKQKEIEKEEEKRKKDEERKLKEIEKEEEKRKKEEERKKREEEKRKEEEEKNKKLEKQRAILLGYLRKEKNEQADLPDVVRDLQSIGGFKPIAIKKDMKISSLERIKKKLIKSLVEFQKDSDNYLLELSNKKVGNGICQQTWPIPEPDIEIATSKRLKTKTFLFLENIRPAYFGTWRKKSEIITRLTPLVEDKTFFDYELDSDQEWEYESGEDIASSDNEEDEEINEEPEDISFLVPHGYLSDDEDVIDVDPGEELPANSSNKLKKPLTNETKQIMIDIREKQFQAEVKQQIHQINPNITGPVFIRNESLSNSTLSTAAGAAACELLFQMVCRNGEGFPINCNLLSDYDNTMTNNSKIKGVPPEAVPHIIRLVHCNQLSKAKLSYEFRMFWEYNLTKKLPDVTFENDSLGKDWDEFSIGKKRFTDKLREIAEWKEGMWVVKSEVIQEYQLCCVNDDPQKPCTEKWKYVSEVLNIDSKKLSKKPKKRKGENQLLTSVNNEKLSKFENDTKLLLEKSK